MNQLFILFFQVYEAIQLGAQVIKENKMEVEEVQLCLQELDEFMVSQETIYNALGDSITWLLLNIAPFHKSSIDICYINMWKMLTFPKI